MVESILSSQSYVMAKKLLDASALRQEALASNVANAETPGYKRVDLAPDFDAQLRAAAKDSNVGALRALEPTLTFDKTAASVRPDGNNVSLDKELMQINRNTVEYQFLTQYLSSSLQKLQSAIRSQTSGN